MLTLDLLRTRVRDGRIEPRWVDVASARHLRLAETLIRVFDDQVGHARRQLERALDEAAGDRVDYRIQRGLTKLLTDDRCTFQTDAAIAPEALRQAVFAAARRHHPVTGDADLFGGAHRDTVLAEAAAALELTAPQVERGLYADLLENHRLAAFDPPEPQALLERYNVALAQAMLYRCRQVSIEVAQQPPMRYRQLFAAVKLQRLIHTVTATDRGYRIVLDGPVSLLRHSLRYGVRLAAFLPALLHCARFRLTARVPDDGPAGRRTLRFELDHTAGLVSHHKAWSAFDSELEAVFARRFAKLGSDWQVERETAFVDLKDAVLIPDFAFRHADGRTRLLEIVGYWRPDYLAAKLDKLRRAGRPDLLVAVSERLNVSKDEVEALPGPVLWFKGRLDPKAVLAALNA